MSWTCVLSLAYTPRNAEIKKLDNSVYHLKRTNEELAVYLPQKKPQSGVTEGSFDSQTIGSRDAEIQAMEDEEQLRRLSDDNSDDTEMLNGVIKENEYTIASQQERVALLKYAKSIKVGGGPKDSTQDTPPTDIGLSL